MEKLRQKLLLNEEFREEYFINLLANLIYQSRQGNIKEIQAVKDMLNKLNVKIDERREICQQF